MPKTWNQLIRREIIRRRDEDGLTYYRIAKDLDLDPTTLGKYIRGERHGLCRRNTERLAKYLGFVLVKSKFKETTKSYESKLKKKGMI